MRNSRTVAIVLILVGLLSVPARPEVIPGRWEKVEALKLGPRITVELKNGNRLEGQFEELSPPELLLRTGSAQAAVPRADIERIITREADSLRDGALLGAVAGAGIIVSLAAAHDNFSPIELIYTAIAAGAGAAIGLGIDTTKKTEVVLYRAP